MGSVLCLSLAHGMVEFAYTSMEMVMELDCGNCCGYMGLDYRLDMDHMGVDNEWLTA